MIPKIFHYCWFGGQELPEEYKEYIEEWERIHPDWEIKRWDETNSPMHLPYIQTALTLGNYANISNLVRFFALKAMGGVYLDTDVKVLKKLDDLLTADCFLGFESFNEDTGEFWINNAILGSISNHAFSNYCFDEIQRQFDGSEKANLSAPVIVTNILKEHWGLKAYGLQTLNGIQLFPVEYFYPVRGFESYKAKKDISNDTLYPNAYTIHCWGRAWYTREMFIKDIEVLQEYSIDLEKGLKNRDTDIQSLEGKVGRLTARIEVLERTLLAKEEEVKALEMLRLQQINEKEELIKVKEGEILEKEGVIKEREGVILEKEGVVNKLLEDIIHYQQVVYNYQKQYEQKSAWEIVKYKIKSKKYI